MEKQYFISDKRIQSGPYNLEEIQGREINEETLIWSDGWGDWKLCEEADIRGFAEKVNIETKRTDPIQPNTFWFIIGFISAFLGGILGFAFGMNYAFGKYDTSIKVSGWLMMIIAIIVLILVRGGI